MTRAFDGFDWDSGNRTKCGKHGVSVHAIESLFAGPVAILPDPGHSVRETRLKAIGYTSEGRAVFLVFTERRRGARLLIRPISARYMHAKEIKAYEKAIARSGQ